MSDGFLRLLELFVQQRQVVVAIGEAGIAAQRRLVRAHRLGLAIHVVEEHAEVVEQHRIVATGFDRLAIDVLGLREAPGFVEEQATVDARIEARGIRGDGLCAARLQR